MRKITALLFALTTFVASAQIELEHTYPERMVQRVKFEQAGEKYYVLDRTTRDLVLYNADHTVWKTIGLDIPPTTPYTAVGIFNVSESDFNTDGAIEVAYAYYTPTGAIARVIAEDGTPYLSLPGCSRLEFSRIAGAADKLIAIMTNGSSRVYDLPEYNLQTTFDDGAATRVQLEYSGEKYYLLDPANNLVKVYNADFSFWKSLSVPMPVGAENKKIELLSESLINPDPLIELAYTYSVTAQLQTHYGSLISETAVLLSPVNASSFTISQVDGLEDKLIVGTMTPVEFGPGDLGTNVYQLPTLNLEQIYPKVVRRKKLEVSGEKFFISYPGETVVRIYNGDHTLWKSVALPQGEAWGITFVEDISEHFFNSDAALELMYSYYTGIGYNSLVINETGTIFGTMYGAYSIAVSVLPGLEKKIISRNYDEITASFISSGVYSIDETMKAKNFNPNTSVVYPNPVADVLRFKTEAAVVKVQVYDLLGNLVRHESGQDMTQINIDGLPPGYYTASLTDANQVISVHKIVVAR